MKPFALILCLITFTWGADTKPQYDVYLSRTGTQDNPILIKTSYCKGTKIKCGKQIKQTAQGVVIFRASYLDDKYHGEVISYYPNKALQEKRQYNHGKEYGLRQAFYPNGTPKLTQYYEDGKREGEGKKFYEDGILQEEFIFKNDKREGLAKEYDKLGKIRYESFSREGKKQWVKHYDAQGNLTKELNCKWEMCF